MKRGGPAEHPLAGVLDRLLARERGRAVRSSVTAPPGPAPARATVPAARRMLVVAGLGADRGEAAARFVLRQAVGAGRRPAVLDLACGDGPLADPPRVPAGSGDLSIPVARVPCGLERLSGEPEEVVRALMDRLGRHEAASDLLVVRIPVRYRMAVARAAFLGGGLIVPIDDSDRTLDEAFRLSREIVESFAGVALWPFAATRATLERYLAMARDFLRVEPVPLDGEGLELAQVLHPLPEPPGEGFAAALLTPGAAAPPAAELLQLDSIRL